ncbi:NUAK family SNF1-like kinase 1 [Lates japonicus]|uniref:NUAK family SNF1-like kinase 1 n=1 Tax=Lates japonicus TaxID=270547 RepID=A0AAD3NM97_LATJO|nr:NUAK family SNF1-like kinase 1 [Lates japonicus]
MAVDPECLSPESSRPTQCSHHPFYFSLPLKSDRGGGGGGGGGGRARGGMSSLSQPSSKMPKKGILKNLYGGESGYGSPSDRRGLWSRS